MIRKTAFANKLHLALSGLGFSRARLAVEVGVDKSLVGRWVSGAVRPSDHNLSRITAVVACHFPNFIMLDWERELHDFAARLGIDHKATQLDPSAGANDGGLGLALPFVDHARAQTTQRGSTYQGFWRTSRPSVLMPDTIFQDRGMIRLHSNGLLEVRMGAAGLSFTGWMFLAEGNAFVMLHDTFGQTPLFLIFRGVPLPKADVLEGILLMAALNPGRTPSAVPILLERIGDLSGDAQADEEHYQQLVQSDPRLPVSALSEETRECLLRDIGPEAAAQGGSMFLLATAAGNLTRGSTATGQLTG